MISIRSPGIRHVFWPSKTRQVARATRNGVICHAGNLVYKLGASATVTWLKEFKQPFLQRLLMAPQILDSSLPVRPAPVSAADQVQYPAPLKPTGALDKFKSEETTPAIGREFPAVNIVDDILNASNSDELVRELAITSKRFPGMKYTPTLTTRDCSLPTRRSLLPRPRQSHR